MNLLQEYKEQFAPNASMHKIISAVDTTKERDFNIALLVSIKVRVAELKDAILYLKQSFNETYKNQILVFEVVKNMTKPMLMDQIMDFIYKTVPSQCAKCEAGYVPLGQDLGAEGAVECIRCRLPAHADCYKAELFNIQHGVVFVCQPCVTRIRAEVLEEEERKEKAKAAVEKDEDESDLGPKDTTDDESESEIQEVKSGKKKEDEWQTKKKKIRKKKKVYVTDIDDTTDEEEDRKTNKKKSSVCPLLVEGKCPHGAAGRGCKYPHKRKCYYFINYGTIQMHKMGCKYGEDCRQLHPTLCQNSVRMKACYNESCTQAHLRYTKRNQNEGSYSSSYAKSNDRFNRGAYNKRGASNGGYRRGAYSDRQQQTQNHSQNASSWKPYVERRQDADSQPQTHSFLEESMKKIEQTLIQKMQEQIEAQFNKMQYNVQYPTNYYD